MALLATPTRLRRAAQWVQHGGVIAYPTEAVYGLGCDPWNSTAVQRVLALKQRDAAKGLILIAADFTQLLPFLAPLPAAREPVILAQWPGPVTWILPAAKNIPRWLTGGRTTLAVRVTAHPGAAALCRACATALVSTSANRSGSAPARSRLQVQRYFSAQLDDLLPGACGTHSRPSTLIDGSSGCILRS